MDTATIARIARLSRLALSPEQQQTMAKDLGTILQFVEQLDRVDVTGMTPVANVHQAALRWRDDVVTDGNKPVDVLSNAPQQMANFYVVPKVVE